MLGYVDDPENPTDMLRHRFPSKVGGRPVSPPQASAAALGVCIGITGDASVACAVVVCLEADLATHCQWCWHICRLSMSASATALERSRSSCSLSCSCTVVPAGMVGPCQPAHPAAADMSCDRSGHEVPAASILPCGQQPSGRIPQECICVRVTQGEHGPLR